MQGQLIHDWDDLYDGDAVPPWEDLQPNIDFCSLVQRYAHTKDKILELGCGLGHNAVYLARQGLNITATDVSENAVRQVTRLSEKFEAALNTEVLDVLDPDNLKIQFTLVYDKGCFHSFFTLESRARFVQAVSALLPRGGYWVSSIGSADHLDAPEDPFAESYPRLSLTDIAASVEPFFEIVEVRKGRYGQKDHLSFKTWECVFLKRQVD